MRKCTYANKYKAVRSPSCGCDACKKKWLEKEHTMYWDGGIHLWSKRYTKNLIKVTLRATS